MALVVTAPPAVEAQPTPRLLAAPRGRRHRLAGVLPWLALAGAFGYALVLVSDSVVRLSLPLAWVDPTALVVNAVAVTLVVALCVAAWTAARDDAGLLLAATLAPILLALRAVSSGLLVAVDLPTLADVSELALGLLVLGCLVWAATSARIRPTVRGLVSHPAAAVGLGRLAGAAELPGAAAGVARLAGATGLPETAPGDPRLAGAAPATVRVGDAALLFRRVVEVTAFVVFGVGLSGAAVRAVGASWACDGVFPDCNGLGWLPFGRDPLADVQLYHRLLAYVALGLVLWLVVEAFRTQRGTPAVGRASLALLGTVVAQGALGAVSVSVGNPPLLEVLHTAGAALSWSAAVALAVVAHRAGALPAPANRAAALLAPANGRGALAAPASRPLDALATAPGWSRGKTLSAYVQLTKPRVMSLLLATTATAMVIAARGMPPLGLFLATLLGGALMSGGAGAINHYVDRDIDPLMGRTAWRPIPSGVISPRRALWFGIALAVLASVILVAFVNVLACLLSLVGLLGYVFIYTLWLKRSTPSNIVIGGAAGAIPPLVGWAAVTNEVSSLTAWYLFAIIFFWTPPHFWALSLLIREHYARAGVPMLPVVRGDEETRRQIVLYSVLLVVLTLVLSPFGMMGTVYFGAALVLGGAFLLLAVRLWRQATRQAARRLYLYSLLYLFALFAAMAVDRVVSSS
jgi:heme o synthase